MPGLMDGFAELVAPLPIDEVARLQRERQVRRQQGSVGKRFLADIDWRTLKGLIERNELREPDVRVFFGRRSVPAQFYTRDDRIAADLLARLLAQDVSLILSNVDACSRRLAWIVEDARREGFPVKQVQAIATIGSGGALAKHYDIYDLIIVQVEGRKQWRISGPPPAELLPVEARQGPPPPTTPIADFWLEPGDLLFLPAGFWHECDSASDLSLHLAFLITPLADACALAAEDDRLSLAGSPADERPC